MSKTLPELIASIMREDRSAVSKGQISVPQFWALHYIGGAEAITVNELARVLNRSKSSTSALLKRLEGNGLVKRQRSTRDQRVVHASLTSKGKRLMKQLEEYRMEGIRNTYAPLTAAERSLQMEILEKVLRYIQKPLVLIGVCLVPFQAVAQVTTNTYSLTESVQLGLKQSLAVVNAARQRQIADATRTRALAEAFPTLTGNADYSLYDPENLTESGSTAIGAQISWRVFSGGKTLSAYRASKAYKKLTAYQERRIRETQARDIILSYYQVQLAQTRVASLKQSIQQLTDFEEETRKKHEAGTVSEFDWLSARVSLANERPRLIQAQNDLRLAREQFKNLTYLDDTPFVLTDPLAYAPVGIGLDEVLSVGLGNRPELLEKQNAITLRQEDVKQQRSAYYPSLDLTASYNIYDPDPYSFLPGSASEGWQDHWSVGARATWVLFDGGLRKADLGESKLNLAIEEDEYRDLIRAVSLDIRTQWLRGRDAVEAINATDESIELANRALSIARARFDAGLSTNLEVTQANLELSNARLARAQALYEFLAAVTRTKHAAGMLLEEYEDE